MRRAVIAIAVVTTFFAHPAAGQIFQPAIIYDIGDTADHSVTEAAREGVDLFRREFRIAAQEFGVGNDTQRTQVFESVARGRAQIIVGLGSAQRMALEAAARVHPEKKFTLVDGLSDLPNVQSLTFREQEGSFLVGMLAALASINRKVGFVGGMDIPPVRRVAAGYAAGARYVDPTVTVLTEVAGATPAAWQNPALGIEIARGQFKRGIDVVFADAGTTGLGVLRAAADNRKLAIGVDSNQDYLYPGTVLTSLVKRVDIAVYEAFRSALKGTWKPGLRTLGLAERGIDYTLDDYNDALVTKPMRTLVEDARADIIAGKIKVPDRLSP